MTQPGRWPEPRTRIEQEKTEETERSTIPLFSLCNNPFVSCRRAQILAARFGIRAMFGNNRYPEHLFPTYGLRSTAYSLRGWS